MNISIDLPRSSVAPLERYVSFHAVQRYFERVLEMEPGPTVLSLGKGATAQEIAMAWCRDAGTDIDSARKMIASPAVVAAIEAGVSKIRFGEFWIVVADKTVVTFLPKRERGRIMVFTKKERQNLPNRTRVIGLRRGRRSKGRS